jgi:hypothetical protein
MQKNLRVIILISILFCSACQGNKQKNIQGEISSEEPISFFPVTDFLLGQLGEIDKLPVTPLQININGDQQDSTWLKREDIRKLALPFLHPVIDSTSMAKYFVGKSFLDQTINAFTFSYDAKTKLPDSIKLVHWDVYVDPQKNDVQRIYMVKEDIINTAHIITQLTWKSNKWFSVRTIIQSPGKEAEVKEEILKWDFNE